MSKTLEQLRKENRQLRLMEESDREMREIEQTRKREIKLLKKENFNLRNKKKVIFVKKAGSGLAKVGKFIGKGIVKAGEQYAKAQESQRQPPKKIKKVRRVKRRSEFGFPF